MLGGALIEWLTPTAALHAAAAIVAVAPLGVIFGSLFLIDEKRSPVNLRELKETLAGLRATFRRRELWLVGFFLFLYFFSPGFATPLYYQMTDNLRFLARIHRNSGSDLVGGLGRRRPGVPAVFSKTWILETLLNLSIATRHRDDGGLSPSFDQMTAAILNFCSGFARHDRDSRDTHARG